MLEQSEAGKRRRDHNHSSHTFLEIKQQQSDQALQNKIMRSALARARDTGRH